MVRLSKGRTYTLNVNRFLGTTTMEISKMVTVIEGVATDQRLIPPQYFIRGGKYRLRWYTGMQDQEHTILQS
jgi:hypothetical protein